LVYTSFFALDHHSVCIPLVSFFVFEAPAPTEISTLSLHDALPICAAQPKGSVIAKSAFPAKQDWMNLLHMAKPRVEETADKVAKAKAMPGT